MKTIKISDFQKEDVLLALYNHAKYGGPGYASNPVMQRMGRMRLKHDGSRERAAQLISERRESGRWYFDEVDLGAGPKQIKVNLAGAEFDATLFDEAHGEGQAARAINSITEAAAEAAFEKALAERFSLEDLLELDQLLQRSKNAIIADRQKRTALPDDSSSPPESDQTDETKKAVTSASEKKKRI